MRTISLLCLLVVNMVTMIALASEHYMEETPEDIRILEQGDAEALYNRGKLWQETYDVINNDELAFKFFEKAAEKGYAPAQYELGKCYLGYPPDTSNAVKWFGKAVEQGYAPAQLALGETYRASWQPEIRGQAFPLLKAAAEQSDANALYRLWMYYGSDEDKNVDTVIIYEWLKKSAENGRAEAQLQLGWCYERGEGFPKDIEKAMEWYERGAETNDSHLQHGFALRFLHGDEWMAKDEARYVKWLTKSAYNKFPCERAQYDLVLYYVSKGDKEEATKAVERLRKRAEGHGGGMKEWITVAQFYMGVCHEKGEGVSKDIGEAIKWYEKSLETYGNEQARERLKELRERMKEAQATIEKE